MATPARRPCTWRSRKPGPPGGSSRARSSSWLPSAAASPGARRSTVGSGGSTRPARQAMKTAFVFPGQGSQEVGMGKAFALSSKTAAAVWQEADEALGFSISRLCFEGPREELTLTENTQPAVLTASVAAAAVLTERGLAPDLAAGHSLGEYSALVVAGALAFRDAVRLVRQRGQFMQEAVPVGAGAMAALMGAD